VERSYTHSVVDEQSRHRLGLSATGRVAKQDRVDSTVQTLVYALTPMLEDNTICRNHDQLSPHRSVDLQSCQALHALNMVALWSRMFGFVNMAEDLEQSGRYVEWLSRC
jgi:hypothetical protein